MRRTLIISVLTLAAVTASAQSHSDRIGLGAGLLYEPAAQASLFWEHETRYHNAWEVFATGYLKYDRNCDNLLDGYKTWGVGFAVKPCVYRARNSYGCVRIGASAGSDTDKFVAGVHLGYEHNYALRHGWRVYWRAGVDVMLPRRDDLFRSGVSLGVKLPSSNHFKRQ